jgi:hypothetical protein
MQRTVKNGDKYEHSLCMRETCRINDVRDLTCREYILGCHEMLNYRLQCCVMVNYILASHKILSYISVRREILKYNLLCN